MPLAGRKLFKAEAFSKRFARASEHLSCREVAKELGIGHATVNRVQRGFEPDIETYLRIVKWMRNRS
jgi:hypothetical protein